MLIDMLDDPVNVSNHIKNEGFQAKLLPFMHKQDVRSTTHVRMDSHWEDEVVELAIVVVKVVLSGLSPQGCR